MDYLLEISHLSKQYPGFALQDVSFSVPKGTIMGFVGENGAGKTTTIKLILNELTRNSGSIRVLGKDNLRYERQVKQEIGVVFDESYFHGEFQAGQLASILRNIYANWDDALYQNYLAKFSLPANQIIKEYSKGMKMKLAIATALAHHPKLLILDEATSGLDPIAREEVLDAFLDFMQDEEHGILFSSHITSDLEKIADYITFLHKGKVVFSKAKDELLYQFGLYKCGKQELNTLKSEEYVAWRTHAFGCEALINDRAAFRRRHPGAVVDTVNLDEIMSFYVKGQKSKE